MKSGWHRAAALLPSVSLTESPLTKADSAKGRDPTAEGKRRRLNEQGRHAGGGVRQHTVLQLVEQVAGQR
jgi:hypothetical protein